MILITHSQLIKWRDIIENREEQKYDQLVDEMTIFLIDHEMDMARGE